MQSLNTTLHRISPAVLSRDQVLQSGVPRHRIRTLIENRTLHRIRIGWYIDGSRWASMRAEEQHLVAIIALLRDGRVRAPIFSHRSAATLFELPIWSDWIHGRSPIPDPSLTHILVRPRSHGNPPGRTRRHRTLWSDTEVDQIEGVRCTTMQRTLLDVARSEPFPVALACADAVLRRTVRSEYLIDEPAWQDWRDSMLARASELSGGRGVTAARAIAALAHPLADSPLESVSRLRLLQLGIDVDLQHPVPAEDGGTLRLDFRFAGLEVFGECDGKVKYLDEDTRGERTSEQIAYSEKLRYDWICGTTGMRGVRWGVSHVVTAHRLAARLREFRIAVPGTATLSHGPEVADFLNRLPQ